MNHFFSSLSSAAAGRRFPCWTVLAAGAVLLTPSTASAQSARVVITPAAGYSIVWDGNNGGYSDPEGGARGPENDASASKGVTTFASSSFQPGGIHDHVNINDGFYGNSSSWIADFAANPPDTQKFVGVSFGRTVEVKSVAWSRDNGDATEGACGGTCTDRAVGVYTIQFTRAAGGGADLPEGTDPATGWVDLGTVEYKAGTDNNAFRAHLRHRFDVSDGVNPVAATGLRLKVSEVGTCIDELEVNPPADPTPPLANFITITNTPAYSISWDLNDGKFSTSATPAPAPRNRALASAGTQAFGSSEFGAGVHFITNVIDGLYGNAHSWIPNFSAPDKDPYIGLNFGTAIELRNVAWGRDNGDGSDCCGGELTDRALGIYTIQVTRVPNPGTTTEETGDPATGWATVGQVNYRSAGGPFTPHKRHRFDIAGADGKAVVATGLRLKVPDTNTAIDELEVNARPALEQDLTENLTLTPSAGYALEWDGNDGDFFSAAAGARTPTHDGLASRGAKPFGSSELDFGIHFIRNVADGKYGNSSSWISDRGVGGGSDQDPFVGVAFPQAVEIGEIAFGRDNGDTTEGGCGGTCVDRSLGVYTVQITTVANPGRDTPETGEAASGWETIGTIEYKAAAAPAFNPSLRHAFIVSKGGKAVAATGLRLKVSDGNIAIDEIEVNPQAVALVPPVGDLLAIRPASGFGISWDRNEGEYTSPDKDAPARNNAALSARGGVAFGSSELDLGVHFIRNVNDGIYGNAHSWIAKFLDPADTAPFIGVQLPSLMPVRSIAWGRDNGDTTDCCGGTLTDRSLGTYTLQVTRVSGAGRDTVETGDAATGWQTVGTLEFKAAFQNVFTPHLRHRFEVTQGGGPILATAVRLKVSSNQLAIDELEVNPEPVVDQNVLALLPETGFAITWDGNNGDYFTAASPAPAPANEALASNGATALGSSQLDLGVHFIKNVNDGAYGNARSWIADFIGGDTDPWVGVAFGKSVSVSSVAWGRDNGDASDCCGGSLIDRAAGTYVLQFTEAAAPAAETAETGDPATGWASIGQVQYRGGGTEAFRHHLRHEFKVSKEGAPIRATGIRLKVSSNQMAIDELEVNPQPVVPPGGAPKIDGITVAGGEITITWGGGEALEVSDAVTGTWTVIPNATSPWRAPAGNAGPKFYRLRR